MFRWPTVRISIARWSPQRTRSAAGLGGRSPNARAALVAIADRLQDHAEAFMSLLTSEQGKPRAMAQWVGEPRPHMSPADVSPNSDQPCASIV